MTQALPTSIKIGRHTYSILSNPGLSSYGRIYYSIKAIDIKPRKPKLMRESFWHETTHAILSEMSHPLCKNEQFVTQFSRMLSRAIDSARFK